jgi:hypothetical protein
MTVEKVSTHVISESNISLILVLGDMIIPVVHPTALYKEGLPWHRTCLPWDANNSMKRMRTLNFTTLI